MVQLRVIIKVHNLAFKTFQSHLQTKKLLITTKWEEIAAFRKNLKLFKEESLKSDLICLVQSYTLIIAVKLQVLNTKMFSNNSKVEANLKIQTLMIS